VCFARIATAAPSAQVHQSKWIPLAVRPRQHDDPRPHLREGALRAAREVGWACASDSRRGGPVEQPRDPAPPVRPDPVIEIPHVLHAVPVIQPHHPTNTPVPNCAEQGSGHLHGRDVLLDDAECDERLNLPLKEGVIGEGLSKSSFQNALTAILQQIRMQPSVRKASWMSARRS